MAIPHSRRFAQRAALWTLVLGTGGTALALVLAGRAMAWGVALGALAGGLNVVAMADEIAWTLHRAGQLDDDQTPRRRPFTRFRWPLLVLALAGILWYTPARPEGVAGGILLVLAAAVIAGLQSQAPPPPTHPGPTPPTAD